MNQETDFESLTNAFKRQKRRCEELNNLKLAIRKKNDTTREELIARMDKFVDLLKQKLDEFCSSVKEELKVHHKQVNEKQTSLEAKISTAVSYLATQLLEVDGLDASVKQEKLSELFQACSKQHDEVEKELKGYEVSNVCPDIRYSIPSVEFENAIKALKINIENNQVVALDEFTVQEKFKQLKKVTENAAFDCVVTTGLDDNGKFWLKLSTEDFSEDDISLYIRYKRITDLTWTSFIEANVQPAANDKCFCLNTKTHKWWRGVVQEYNQNRNAFKVRCLDTHCVDADVKAENMLQWQDSCLDQVEFQTLRCCLFEAHKKLVHDTKYLFKDLTAKKSFKCVFKLKLSDAWLVELYNPSECESSSEPLNKRIFEDYNENANLNKSMGTMDIRLEERNAEIKLSCNVFSYTDKQPPTAEDEAPKKLSHSDSMNVMELINSLNLDGDKEGRGIVAGLISDIISQLESAEPVDEKGSKEADDDDEGPIIRSPTMPDPLYKYAEEDDAMKQYGDGTGIIASNIDEHGIFWISLRTSYEDSRRYEKMTYYIERHLNETKQKSYKKLGVTPAPNEICFVRLNDKNSRGFNYRRVLIESIDLEGRRAASRVLDRGSVVFHQFSDLFPYTELPELKMKFKAIRCSLTMYDNVKICDAARAAFNKLRLNTTINYILMEKVEINKLQCWHTAIQMQDKSVLNETVLRINEQAEVERKDDDSSHSTTARKKKNKSKRNTERGRPMRPTATEEEGRQRSVRFQQSENQQYNNQQLPEKIVSENDSRFRQQRQQQQYGNRQQPGKNISEDDSRFHQQRQHQPQKNVSEDGSRFQHQKLQQYSNRQQSEKNISEDDSRFHQQKMQQHQNNSQQQPDRNVSEDDSRFHQQRQHHQHQYNNQSERNSSDGDLRFQNQKLQQYSNRQQSEKNVSEDDSRFHQQRQHQPQKNVSEDGSRFQHQKLQQYSNRQQSEKNISEDDSRFHQHQRQQQQQQKYYNERNPDINNNWVNRPPGFEYTLPQHQMPYIQHQSRFRTESHGSSDTAEYDAYRMRIAPPCPLPEHFGSPRNMHPLIDTRFYGNEFDYSSSQASPTNAIQYQRKPRPRSMPQTVPLVDSYTAADAEPQYINPSTGRYTQQAPRPKYEIYRPPAQRLQQVQTPESHFQPALLPAPSQYKSTPEHQQYPKQRDSKQRCIQESRLQPLLPFSTTQHEQPTPEYQQQQPKPKQRDKDRDRDSKKRFNTRFVNSRSKPKKEAF